MKKICLNGEWALRGREQNAETSSEILLSASVPGCVQLDLSNSGYLPKDLFYGQNIRKTEKFENYEWWYERIFEIPNVKINTYIVFEGVDCIAEYFLNGVKLGQSDNMFIAHEFRVDSLLKSGENVITVHISSATLAAEAENYPIRLLHSPYNLERCYLRKAQHSYGWDIMPRAVTAGIWREVRIEFRDEIYFSQAYIYAPKSSCYFYYTLESDRRNLSGIEIELEGSCGNSVFAQRVSCNKRAGYIQFEVENPKLWFPYGYGEPNVYDCKARIYENGALVHEEDISFGIREIVFDRRDPNGTDEGQFRFLINGMEIMCRGTNWVPLDAFHSRDSERYDKALELVKEIGCNIVRCWGGNVYEDHKFFDFCDRNGIMVWQDFAMACAMYPESDVFMENLKTEVTEVIRKLRNHPSIVLWAGDNENDVTFHSLYDPNENKINRELIPACVRDNDIGRPYLPSSPYISKKMYVAGISSQQYGSTLVENHLWGPRDYFKSSYYTNNKAHFVSEIGYHGCPSLNSIKKFISPEYVWPYHNNAEWILHSSDQTGNDARVMLMEQQVRQLFGEVPTDPEDYILASQISQAEAKKYFIERIRVGRPNKTGVIWWNLLDGWPQMSDAVVDYYFTKKLAFSYIKRSQAPFVIAAGEMDSWQLPIYACNDTPNERQGSVTVKDSETGDIIYAGKFIAKANCAVCIANIRLYYSDQKILIFEWESDGESGLNHYLCGYPPISFKKYTQSMKKYRLMEE